MLVLQLMLKNADLGHLSHPFALHKVPQSGPFSLYAPASCGNGSLQQMQPWTCACVVPPFFRVPGCRLRGSDGSTQIRRLVLREGHSACRGGLMVWKRSCSPRATLRRASGCPLRPSWTAPCPASPPDRRAPVYPPAHAAFSRHPLWVACGHQAAPHARSGLLSARPLFKTDKRFRCTCMKSTWQRAICWLISRSLPAINASRDLSSPLAGSTYSCTATSALPKAGLETQVKRGAG